MADHAILEMFARTEGEPRTTPEVATELGISKPATWKRLTDLYEEGLLEKHPSSGLKTDAWSLSDEGRAALEGEAGAERP